MGEREKKAYYDPLSKSDISPSGLVQSSVHTQTSSSTLQDLTTSRLEKFSQYKNYLRLKVCKLLQIFHISVWG